MSRSTENTNAQAEKINYHEELHNLAQMRAKEISEYYHKNRPDGSNYKTIYDEFEKLKAYRYSSTAEVRGRGFGSPEAALKSWLTSSDSRKEILSDRIIWFAVAVYKENGNYDWVFWSIKRS